MPPWTEKPAAKNAAGLLFQFRMTQRDGGGVSFLAIFTQFAEKYAY